MGLFDFLNNLMGKEEVKQETFDYQRPAEISTVEYEVDIPDVKYAVDNRTKNVPTILIMDDFSGMATLLKDELDRVDGIKVYENFNIVIATGDYAAFSVEKALNEGLTVDVAFLDITLGGVVKGVEYDGVDVAIMIKEKFPKSLCKFVTGHTLNRKNPEIFQFITKFENYFKVNIEESYTIQTEHGVDEIYKHIIQKNSDRVLLMDLALKEYMESSNDN